MALNIHDLAISSPDIASGGVIADRFAAQTGNQMPRLHISGVPGAAVELAVIMHDPDAPLPRGFTHWLVYGIDPAVSQLDAHAWRIGPNSLGEAAYMGPQPPHGHGVHHYYFWVYALDRAVHGEPAREEFLQEYADAILEQNRLVGTYQR